MESKSAKKSNRCRLPSVTAQDKAAKAPREGSQTTKVIALLKQEGGVTLEALMDATGWEKHSVRGFISTLPKKTGLTVTSTRRESDKAVRC